MPNSAYIIQEEAKKLSKDCEKSKYTNLDSRSHRKSSSLQSDISFLLKIMIRNKEEKQAKDLQIEIKKSVNHENLISMNDVGCN